MPEDIERAYIMNQITSSEMQANLKQMDGAGAYNRVIEIINAAPAADVAQVRHGRWEEIRDAYGNLEGWLHTNCGREVKCKEKYCPNCGAKMDLEE